MSRLHRQFTAMVYTEIAGGAVDQDNVGVTGVVPSDGANLVEALIVQKAAGTGTGTLAVFLKAGSTTISSTLSGVDADAVAGTYHGRVVGLANINTLVQGAQIKANTVK